MPQIFHPSANIISRASIFGAVILIGGAAWAWGVYVRSPYARGTDIFVEQPVPFSHEHHVGGLGIDCRYCHSAVETAPSAGMPATFTCMTCHSQIWAQAPMLAPVRQSLASGRPLRWNRVYDLPDFVYFDHSIHVQKGVGCSTCHGDVQRMPLMRKAHSMTMEWCLGCHADPAPYLRPREEVFNLDWRAPPDQRQQGERRIAEYGVRVDQLKDCSLCHR